MCMFDQYYIYATGSPLPHFTDIYSYFLFLQTGCRPDITSVGKINNPINVAKKYKNNSDRFVDEGDLPLHVEETNFREVVENRLSYNRRNAIDRGNEASLKNDIDDDGTVLPCEFCGDGYPASLLLEHQVLVELSYH